MVLVDTSVWIRWFRGGSLKPPEPNELVGAAICSPILQELMQGFDDLPSHSALRNGLLSIPRLTDPLPVDVFLSAADISRVARRKGYTINSSFDCLIAAVAILNNVPVMHVDQDFEVIARFTSLRTVRP